MNNYHKNRFMYDDGLSSLSNAVDKGMKSDLGNNKFPIAAFPEPFRSLILELNASLNFPIDYMATSILGAISATVGTTARIKVKGGWYEYGSLFLCVVGNAGANKTHPMNIAFAPLKSVDAENHSLFTNQLFDFQAAAAADKKSGESNAHPILKKIILTNTTPEVMFKRLGENARGVMIMSDELMTMMEGINNYSKGDQSSQILSAFSNQPTTIDRMGSLIPLFIMLPYLGIIGGIQPRMLSAAFPPNKLNNGFFQRFLFAFPDNSDKLPINDKQMSASNIEAYNNFIIDYIKSTEEVGEDGSIVTRTLNWTANSKDFFYKWQSENCDRVNENQDSIKGEILSKFDNHFLRLSLLLQMMANPKSEFIEIDAVRGAAALCEYFIKCAFKALATIQDPKSFFNSLSEDKKSFYSSLPQDFTTADAVSNGSGYNISERNVKSFLTEDNLFRKTSHGKYSKKIKSK